MNETFAMDTGFFSGLGEYEFATRCEMTRELGYDATYLTIWSERAWNNVSKLGSVADSFGLDVAAVWVTLDLSLPAEHPDRRRIVRLIESLEGTHRVELCVKFSDSQFENSDPSGDGIAIEALDELCRVAAASGIQLLLYPHVNTWLERLEDAVRLCRVLASPERLALTFPTYHWYTVDGTDLEERVTEASPFLGLVNICGARTVEGRDLATIEPLDEGELDNFLILGHLRRLNYRGPIGIQGYSVAGDAYSKLRRSLSALKDMQERLAAHPNWSLVAVD